MPFAAVAVVIAYLAGPGSGLAGLGTPLPEITIEQVDFVDGEIRATVRNTGPMPVDVVIADVNDRIQPAAIEPDKHLERFETAVVRIPFPWNEAEPYRIGLTIDDGTRFEREVEAAAPAPEAGLELLGSLALIGTYVGIVPVMLGLAWLPFIRRISGRHYAFFLSITVGLLLFLGIDAIEEAAEVADENLSESFNGLLLIATVTTLSFLALYYAGGRLAAAGKSGLQKPMAVGLMIAVGIGLHNLGEGLAIGAAIGLGQAALGAFLIVGFALHNTTEGMAIAAPASRAGATVPMLAALGLMAGAPAILGAWIGGFFYSPFSAVIFLSVGAGAILQVMVVVLRWIRGQDGVGLSGAPVAAGIATGMAVMYLTSIII
ncbi:divalent heavy-metal cation transporter [Cenarchaeum symbiosum A]|uniref:Divalent heavy-metal cation transporter n=1 Tax=Cenarchaeum symbiosum (strain A) TaxID=414004 RepID=A0RXY4_CENSY|nr:divalent heavy-metal cation transporter [Cenarchaeum symbiosum A]